MKAQAPESCATCRGSGWCVVREDEVEKALPCPNCRSQAELEKLLKNAQIPPRYFDRGFDTYSVHHPLQGRAVGRAIEYVEAFPNVPRGLLFVGKPGVGKTHLSVAILKVLIEEKAITGKFVDESELLRRLQYSYGPDSVEAEREVLRPLLDADLLVWDDLGVGRPTDWALETIRMVINYRYTYKKLTILSTNRPLREEPFRSNLSIDLPERPRRDLALVDRVGRPLFSRIMEMCEIIEIDGPDARTEIHKASLDSPERVRRSAITGSENLHCPKCDSSTIRKQESRPAKGGRYTELSCVCEKCEEYFTAQISRTGRIKYSD